jgi:hypothetical protein
MISTEQSDNGDVKRRCECKKAGIGCCQARLAGAYGRKL